MAKRQKISESSSSWQHIPIDILELIVNKSSVGDYIRMGAVCMSWRSTILAHKNSIRPSDCEAPWLLQLKDCEYTKDKGFNFYSLSDERFYSFKLPNHILNKYPKINKGPCRCCSTSNGWLVLKVGPSRNPDMFLFDPISQKDVKLPPLTTLPIYPLDQPNTPKIVLLVQVFTINNNLTVAAAFYDLLNNVEQVKDILAFCNCETNEEERSWEIFVPEIGGLGVNYESMLFHKGVLHVLIHARCDFDDQRIGEERNDVVILKPDCELKLKLITVDKYHTAHHIRGSDRNGLDVSDYGLKYVYLAESVNGELLIVWNDTDPLSEDDNEHLHIYHTSKLTIERYEGISKTCEEFEPIASLDDEALFVSPSCSFSIPSTSGNECQTNCIYFTVDAFHALDLKSLALNRQAGIYCMRQGRIKRPFPNPPLWFQPRLRNL